jgi:RNA polymerase sigma-70 factor (ECF subfamily)
MPTSLDDTVKRAVAGDQSALESLLLHFHDPLLRFIQHSLAPIPGLSPEDLLQETMIEVFRGMRGLKPQGSDAFFAWLKTIAQTRRLNFFAAANAQKRGGGRKPITSDRGVDGTVTSVLHLLIGPDRTPSLIVRRNEAVGIVTKALNSLDADRRRIIDLRYGRGCSIRDIADREGKGEGAIKMLIHRTMNELRDAIRLEFGDFSIDE